MLTSNSSKYQVVGAVLIRNNRVILTKRSLNCKHYPNFYEFPGGKVETDESLKQALIRELNEELSIQVDNYNLISFPNNQVETEKIILTLFIISNWSGQLVLKPNIHSQILETEIFNLSQVDNLIDNDKLLINSIMDYLI